LHPHVGLPQENFKRKSFTRGTLKREKKNPKTGLPLRLEGEREGKGFKRGEESRGWKPPKKEKERHERKKR